jgi:hypothetical protein
MRWSSLGTQCLREVNPWGPAGRPTPQADVADRRLSGRDGVGKRAE